MKSTILIVITFLLEISFGFETRPSLQSSRKLGTNGRDLAQEQRNKEVVLKFYTQVFGRRDLTSIDQFFGNRYIQHNPGVYDGPEGFITWITSIFPPGTPPFTRFKIEHIAAAGDLVWLHSLNNIAPIPTPQFDEAVVDIYRLENERLVEHWDVVQAVPTWSLNSHPLMNAVKGFNPKCGYNRS